jgi:hypothetical protein
MNGVSDAQRSALGELASIIDPATYLAGGVAVALHFRHRQSRDLDLFVSSSDPTTLSSALEQTGIRILTRSEGTLYLEVSGVPASILRYRYPLLEPATHQILDAYVQKYAAEDVGHVVRSLVYFTDAEAEPMPVTLTKQHWAKIKDDLSSWVRTL